MSNTKTNLHHLYQLNENTFIVVSDDMAEEFSNSANKANQKIALIESSEDPKVLKAALLNSLKAKVLANAFKELLNSIIKEDIESINKN